MKDRDERWRAIGELVEKHGTQEEKTAWGLCRADAAEWRLEAVSLKEREKRITESFLRRTMRIERLER